MSKEPTGPRSGSAPVQPSGQPQPPAGQQQTTPLNIPPPNKSMTVIINEGVDGRHSEKTESDG